MEPEITTDSSTGASTQDKAIYKALESTLKSSSDLVSSADSGIETAISSAIQGVNSSRDAQADRINSTADEQSRSIQRSGLIKQTDAVEGRRGFATQTAVLRDVLNTTNQELKDLETRRHDLLATGESEAASQVAQLQVQSMQLAQEAKQNAISNMIQSSNQMFNFRRLQMDEEQQKRENAVSTIATLNDIGTLKNSDAETLRNLEKAGGLPAGTLSDIPDIPAEYEIRQVGKSLIAVDPTNPTDMQVLYSDSSGGSGGADTLSLSDTQKLGLPISLAGLTEGEVVTSLASSDVPDWYRVAEGSVQGIIDQATGSGKLVKDWNNFRTTLLNRTAVPKEEDEESSIIDDIIKAKTSGTI